MSKGHRSEAWTTVAVTALPPGWRNVYTNDDGSVTTEDCPAILLQEHRTTRHWTDDDRPLRTVQCEPPYDTRAVFADTEYCALYPADGVDSYAGTVGPNGNPHDYAK